MLISSTDAIVAQSLFISNSSMLSFRSFAWTMERRELFTLTLSSILFILDYPSLKNIPEKFISGITNLVGNSPFSLIVLWYFMRSFGDGIARFVSDCLKNCSSWTEKSVLTFSINPFASSNRTIAFGQRESSVGDPPLMVIDLDYLSGVGFVCRKTDKSIFFIFWNTSWISLVFLFRC